MSPVSTLSWTGTGFSTEQFSMSEMRERKSSARDSLTCAVTVHPVTKSRLKIYALRSLSIFITLFIWR